MKKAFFGAAMLAASITFQTPANAAPEEQPDPAIKAIVDLLSERLEYLSGNPLDEQDKQEMSKGLRESFNRNIREGSCRDVVYGVTRNDIDLSARVDVCRKDDNYIIGPYGIQPY